MEQVFQLIAPNGEAVGFIGTDAVDHMVLSLNDFWGVLYSKEMKLPNVNDFITTIWGECYATAIVECDSCSCADLTVSFKEDGNGAITICIYHPNIGKIYARKVSNAVGINI